MSDIWRASVIQTLSSVGGHVVELLRSPKDDNGQPSGKPEAVGALYGCRYYKRRAGSVGIDIQGIVSTDADTPRFACVRTRGDAPQAGDTLRCGEMSAAVVSVQTYREDIFILTLEKDVSI